MINPITPAEIANKQREILPDFVIETWNKMMAEAWNGYSAVILQKYAVKTLGGTGEKCAWLNIEDIYRAAGWHVEYDKPGHNESYEASFTFTKSKPKN